MIKKHKKKRNPIAKDLKSSKYKQRTVESKKIYNRKKTNLFITEIIFKNNRKQITKKWEKY